MNEHASIDLTADQWNEAARGVNAWRGGCMQCFALAEGAATETLLVLAAIEHRGSLVKLRHLIGQRFEDLASAIDADGPFGKEGNAAAKALAEFREREPLRTHLAHGVAKVSLERNGRWVAVFRQTSIRARVADVRTLVMEEIEAEALLKQLRQSTQKLCSCLDNMRRLLIG